MRARRALGLSVNPRRALRSSASAGTGLELTRLRPRSSGRVTARGRGAPPATDESRPRAPPSSEPAPGWLVRRALLAADVGGLISRSPWLAALRVRRQTGRIGAAEEFGCRSGDDSDLGRSRQAVRALRPRRGTRRTIRPSDESLASSTSSPWFVGLLHALVVVRAGVADPAKIVSFLVPPASCRGRCAPARPCAVSAEPALHRRTPSSSAPATWAS